VQQPERGFEASVREGHVFTVMSSYNALNGIPTTASPFLLTDLLRKRWGFRGYVVSDCDAVGDICRTQRFVSTYAEAAALRAARSPLIWPTMSRRYVTGTKTSTNLSWSPGPSTLWLVLHQPRPSLRDSFSLQLETFASEGECFRHALRRLPAHTGGTQNLVGLAAMSTKHEAITFCH
jgi:Glycosyl hydrolase family 3 N terminal domain